MEIYVDLFIIQSTILNFCIIHLTDIIIKTNSKWYRYLASALFGSIYSVLTLPYGNQLILYKIIISFLMCTIAFKNKNLKIFLKGLFTFYGISFLAGGVVYGLISLIGNVESYGSGWHISVNEGHIVISMAIIYIFGTILHKLWITRVTLKELLWKIEIEILNERYTYTALLDTGNKAEDIYTGYPIIFVQKDKCNLFNLFCIKGGGDVFREIHIQTVSNEESLVGIDCKNIIAKQGNKKYTIDNCVVCFTNNKLDSKDVFDAIIGYETLLLNAKEC